VLEVAQGRADAFIYDQLSIYRYQKENARTTRALLQPIVEEAWAIGLRKGDDELRRQVNAFLKKFRAEGGFAKLGEQYLAEEKRLLEEMGIPFILR
jgi:polar amino acid transport system substrate-binding protein